MVCQNCLRDNIINTYGTRGEWKAAVVESCDHTHSNVMFLFYSILFYSILFPFMLLPTNILNFLIRRGKTAALYLLSSISAFHFNQNRAGGLIA